MKVEKWYSESDIKGSIDAWLKKFDTGTLDGAKDMPLFYKAIQEATMLSKQTDDDDKKELGEIISDDLEEYGTLAYFIEVRGYATKLIMVMDPKDPKIGEWSGAYEPLATAKQNVYMEMTPKCSLKILNGDPNTDAEFFAGDLTVKGPLKLATKPRDWIGAFFEFVGREPKD